MHGPFFVAGALGGPDDLRLQHLAAGFRKRGPKPIGGLGAFVALSRVGISFRGG